MTLYSAGWSDLPLIAIFEIVHIDGNQEYFYEFSSEKSASLTALAEKVLFSTNHRDLKQEAEKNGKCTSILLLLDRTITKRIF